MDPRDIQDQPLDFGTECVNRLKLENCHHLRHNNIIILWSPRNPCLGPTLRVRIRRYCSYRQMCFLAGNFFNDPTQAWAVVVASCPFVPCDPPAHPLYQDICPSSISFTQIGIPHRIPHRILTDVNGCPNTSDSHLNQESSARSRSRKEMLRDTTLNAPLSACSFRLRSLIPTPAPRRIHTHVNVPSYNTDFSPS